MDTKSVKVLDSRSHLNDSKRKRSAQSKVRTAKATGTNSGAQSVVGSPLNKNSKRMKLDVSKSQSGWCSSQSNRSLLIYYSNLKKSSPPARLLCYQKGEWTDLPRNLVVSLKKDFQIKKAAIEVELDGKMFLMDFLHMMKLDLETGGQQPIAWIDEDGSCFFPEIHANHGKSNENEKVHGHKVPEFHGNNDIKLQLEIDVSRLGCSKLKEYTGDSNDLVQKNKVVKNPAIDEEADSSCVKGSNDKVREAVGENQQENMIRLDPFRENIDFNTAREMLLKALSSYKVDKIESSCGSGILMQAQLELFRKQAEITEKYRGDANVKYAWLPTSKDELSRIMTYGLGYCEVSKMKSSYGSGVLLLPVNCAQTSANYCDVDENGFQYVILCRVILGNVEVVHPGSKQFHPSCESYDSGVDDLNDPKHYIVWDMKKNTHIYPLYAVGFKVSSNAGGHIGGHENKLNTSGVTTSCQGPEAQLQPKSGSADMDQVPKSQEVAENKGSSLTKIPPKSPWMPFPLLFAAISDKISPRNMHLINSNFEIYKNKKITREEFVTRLRMLAGDALLRTSILDLQSKMANGYRS